MQGPTLVQYMSEVTSATFFKPCQHLCGFVWVQLCYTVVCTGGVCGLQWLTMGPYGSMDHPCGLAPTQRMYLWLRLEP